MDKSPKTKSITEKVIKWCCMSLTSEQEIEQQNEDIP